MDNFQFLPSFRFLLVPGVHLVHFLPLGESLRRNTISRIVYHYLILNIQIFCDLRSGDSTARIWSITDGTSKSSMQNGPANVVVLRHFKARTIEKSKDVTTLDWNVSVFILFPVVILHAKWTCKCRITCRILFSSILGYT